MGIEHVLLIVTTIAGVLKAYFEMKKAKAESLRAGEAEQLLKAAVEGVEEARAENPEEGKRLANKIRKHTEFLGIDSKFHAIVKEITEGEGDVKKATNKFSKTKFRQVLNKDELLDGKDKYL
jgi:flagellar biosynthesis/type III secretory pathway protein FliH